MLNKLFSENSEISIMRVLSTACVGTAIVISLVSLCIDKDVVALVGTLLGASFVGKAVQKFAEVKESKNV